MKFEEALAKLEKIVQELESGNITLEDSLKKYEEGIKLVKFCAETLERMRKKIEILRKKSNGSVVREPFDVTTKREITSEKGEFLF